eukprot:gnl/MRDRNA2_/MRDRNA2_150801_c0_seq1.p1 gnl/MRDRNA2_/MRDRNA2_150801_c0~~gnl/MRDRNA2_/MRDRNA2_150801_c0_seq1.p1  ORF type:complete len:186 (-),score=56.27 gnl/MRDRNA2_/MRDRNA2_150801_c0_seq1:60-617(-)
MTKYADKANFDVKWIPFQLNPQAEGGAGKNKLKMYKEKFGEERVNQMLPMMQQVGRQEGINFSYGGNTGNTFDSHRLISLALKQGNQDAIIEELFKNYFEEEKCLSDRAVLLAAANKVGLHDAEEMLRSSAEVSEVESDIAKYQKGQSITGVPFFIINGRYRMSGAQDPETFEEIFAKIMGSGEQ